MRMSWASNSEAEQSSHSYSDDSSFVPQEAPSRNGGVRNGRTARNSRNSRNGRKRQRSVQGLFTDSSSDSEDSAPTPGRRLVHRHTDSEESEDPSDVPRQRQRRLRQRVQELEDSDDEEGHVRRTRKNAKVLEAVWTPEKTVRVTYNQGVKHACNNPIHGKAKASYTVLHLVKCTWKHNITLMQAIPSTSKPKLYQYSHKICQACLDKYGPHCFKCDPSEGEIVPKLNTVFGDVAITSVEDFTDSVRKWQQRRDEIEAAYLVLHCTVLGPEARFLRRKFDLKRDTKVHIVYSDVRDRMEPAGSGQNLEDSMFQNVWKTVMAEKVHSQDQPLISFYGNILLNEGVTFKDFKVNDVLVMYQPNILAHRLEGDAIGASINTLSLQLPLSISSLEVAPSECCLRDAVVHVQHEPSTIEDDSLFLHGNLVASLFYKGVKKYFGQKICAEFEQRSMLGEQLNIGEGGNKLPFRKLFAARGGEVQFRRVANATQDVARRGDMRSRVCSADTSVFELVCWTARGAPSGGDFVIPGLMYKFETIPGSALVFRPQRYFHATLPASNRDLVNEKFAASFVTPPSVPQLTD